MAWQIDLFLEDSMVPKSFVLVRSIAILKLPIPILFPKDIFSIEDVPVFEF